MKYRPLVAVEVMDFFAGLRAAERRTLRQRLDRILEYPGNYADYRESADELREVSVNLCGRFAIRYWDDFADRQVKVLRIDFADR